MRIHVARHISLVPLFLAVFLLKSQDGVGRTISLEFVLQHFVPEIPEMKRLYLDLENRKLSYENYRKGFLPAISFQWDSFQFNRSIQRLQNAFDGSYNYVEDYSASTGLNVALQQSLGITGGTVRIGTSLDYLHEFSSNKNNYTTRPFYINLSQPLWGGRKEYQFSRDLARMGYELAFRRFVQERSALEEQAVTLYLNAFLTRLSQEHAVRMKLSSDTLLNVSRLALQHGRITDYEFNQVELECAESEHAVIQTRASYEEALRAIQSFLCCSSPLVLSDSLSVDFPKISADEVLRYAMENNPEMLNREYTVLQARYQSWQTKRENRLQGNISIDYGVNRYASSFSAAYRHPENRQNISVSLTFPLFDWGIGHNKIRMARNETAMAELDAERSLKNLEQNVFEKVSLYNTALSGYALARRSYELSISNYELMLRRFDISRITVSELLDSRRSVYSFQEQYYESLYTLYTYYYQLRTLCLYDFKRHCDMSELFVYNY